MGTRRTIASSGNVKTTSGEIKMLSRHAAAQSSLAVHVIVPLLLLELSLLFCSCVLVLLVLRNSIVHITFSLGALHLIDALD